MLTQTATPTAITQSKHDPVLPQPRVISEPQEIPSKPVYRRPDLRQPRLRELEKIFTLESPINSPNPVDEVLEFELPFGESAAEKFTLSVSLKRDGSTLRSVIRLRKGATQLQFGFTDPQLSFDFEK